MGNWLVALEGINDKTIPLFIQYHANATENDRNWYKVSIALDFLILYKEMFLLIFSNYVVFILKVIIHHFFSTEFIKFFSN